MRAATRVRESRTRYVVLGMLRLRPLTGYGLRQAIAESVGHFWQESFGQLYPALRRLVAEGLVVGEPTRGGPGRPGLRYAITEAGRRELARWMERPPTMEPFRSELLLRVFFARAAPAEATARALDGAAESCRRDLAKLEAIAEGWAALAGRHPEAPCWRLTLDYGITAVKAALAWMERARAVVLSAESGRRAGATQHPRRRGAASRGSE